MKLIYHISTPKAWAAAQASGEVVAESLASEGFIHCSRAAQLLAVADRFFPGASGLLVLAINEARLGPHLVNEGPAGENDPFGDKVFPHVYAPIPVAAVVATAPLTPGDGGNFSWPAGLPRAER